MSIVITKSAYRKNTPISNNPLSYPTCVPYSRMNATKAISAVTGTTFHDTFELQAPASMVRPIFANSSNVGTYTIATCKAGVPTTLTDLNDAGAWVSVTLPSSGVVPASATTQRKGMLVGNWTALDNSTNSKFVSIRCYIAAGAGNITVGTTDTITNWATRTDGRSRVTFQQDVEGVTTRTNFTSTTPVSGSPCIGLQYQTMAGVVTIMKIGDSIDNGQGTYKGESMWDCAVYDIADSLNMHIEIANFAVGSTDVLNYPYHLSDATSVGIIPDIVCLPISSPNGFSPTITSGVIETTKKTLQQTMLTIRQYGIKPVFRTWTPVNYSVKTWAATDSLRVDYNNFYLAQKGVNIADVATVLNGTLRADGQMELNPLYAADGIHPNDAGNIAACSVVKPYLIAAIESL